MMNQVQKEAKPTVCTVTGLSGVGKDHYLWRIAGDLLTDDEFLNGNFPFAAEPFKGLDFTKPFSQTKMLIRMITRDFRSLVLGHHDLLDQDFRMCFLYYTRWAYLQNQMNFAEYLFCAILYIFADHMLPQPEKLMVLYCSEETRRSRILRRAYSEERDIYYEINQTPPSWFLYLAAKLHGSKITYISTENSVNLYD